MQIASEPAFSFASPSVWNDLALIDFLLSRRPRKINIYYNYYYYSRLTVH